MKDLGNSLLLATDFGLWEFNKARKSFNRPACNLQDSALLFHKRIVTILECPHEKNFHNWIMIGDSLLKIDSDFSILERRYFPNQADVWRCDGEGIFWFASQDLGVFIGMIREIVRQSI